MRFSAVLACFIIYTNGSPLPQDKTKSVSSFTKMSFTNFNEKILVAMCMQEKGNFEKELADGTLPDRYRLRIESNEHNPQSCEEADSYGMEYLSLHYYEDISRHRRVNNRRITRHFRKMLLSKGMNYCSLQYSCLN